MPSMVNQGETNASANVESDIMAPRVPISARKKSVEVGSTKNSSREKHKISEVDTLNATSPSSASQGMATDSTRVPPKMVPAEPPEKAVVSSNPPPKKASSKDKSITKKIKNITLRTISESSLEKTKIRNLEPEPQATVKRRAALAPSHVTKKHPCHAH
ncbi:hypothetical protein Tco_1299487, partial [Tanacetum coccineum]